jgi:hypothetical protein
MDKIKNIITKNESIYNSLKSKNINDLGELLVVDSNLSIEEQIDLLTKENNRLINLAKVNKPKVEPKPKPKVEPPPKPKDANTNNEQQSPQQPQQQQQKGAPSPQAPNDPSKPADRMEVD